MKKHSFLTVAMVLSGSMSSLLVLVSCAVSGSNNASPSDQDASADVFHPPDSAIEAAPEADVFSDPCLPDTLCPNGQIFGLGDAGGFLDLRTRINVIRGRAQNDVWAAGAEGAMLHFDGTSWKRSDMGTVESTHTLWLRDSSEVALVTLRSVYTRHLSPGDAGADAAVPSADGWIAIGRPPTQPGVTPPPTQQQILTSSWTAPGAEWLWSTTVETGINQVYNDKSNGLWRLHVLPTNTLELGGIPKGICFTDGCQRMVSIHGVSADDLWAVGYTGATIHITNAQSATPSFRPYDSQTLAGLLGVWAAAENDVWAVGGVGTIRHYTGQSTWDVVSDVPATEDLRAVWGTSSSDIWAVGDNSAVLHYDGKSWSRVNVGRLDGHRPTLYTAWASAPGHVWAGGDGVILSLGGKP